MLGVPRRRHRRPTPAVRLETPAGVDGCRGAPFYFVFACVLKSSQLLDHSFFSLEQQREISLDRKSDRLRSVADRSFL
ncbi:hypothetical protein ANTQUA_LOCUS7882 [Anthophora quadrimaculata]